VHASGLLGLQHIIFSFQCRDEDDRDIAYLWRPFDAPAYSVPVNAGQLDIQQNQRGPQFYGTLQYGFTLKLNHTVGALLLQHILNQVSDIFIIFDNEYNGFFH
jgi:hypothetical protein